MNSSLILVGFVLKTQRQETQSSRYEWHHSSVFADKENWPFFRGRGEFWHVLSDPGQLISLPTLFLHRMDFFFF